MGQRIDRINELLRSRRGRNAITFLVFLVISTVLWCVQTLNDEAQRDLQMSIRLVNVPDTVTRVSPVPKYINVNVRSRGTTLLRYLFNKHPDMTIDYHTYVNGNRIVLNDAALKTYFRNKIGGGCQVITVNPDSIAIYFTSDRGFKVPIKVDAHVEPGPQYAVIGKVRSLTDTVRIFSLDRTADWMRSVTTAPIVLNGVSSSQTLRVPVLTPPNVRAIPDSVDVRVEVEPLVSKSRKIEIETINVPENLNLVLSPRQVEVFYMVPMSIYKKADSDPKFVIQADYNSLQYSSGRIAIHLSSAPQDFMDVFLTADSVSYIIEEKE